MFELVSAHSAPGSRIAVEAFTMDPARHTDDLIEQGIEQGMDSVLVHARLEGSPR